MLIAAAQFLSISVEDIAKKNAMVEKQLAAKQLISANVEPHGNCCFRAVSFSRYIIVTVTNIFCTHVAFKTINYCGYCGHFRCVKGSRLRGQ